MGAPAFVFSASAAKNLRDGMRCPDCDGEAHPKWRAHVFNPVATNTATNTQSATNAERLTDAINAPADRAIHKEPQRVRKQVRSVAVRASGAKARTPNRRSVEDYNAYQRLYMQTRRAVAAGLAELIGGAR